MAWSLQTNRPLKWDDFPETRRVDFQKAEKQAKSNEIKPIEMEVETFVKLCAVDTVRAGLGTIYQPDCLIAEAEVIASQTLLLVQILV